MEKIINELKIFIDTIRSLDYYFLAYISFIIAIFFLGFIIYEKLKAMGIY